MKKIVINITLSYISVCSIGFGLACLYMINKCFLTTIWGALIMADGICYFVAHFRGEKWEDADGDPEALGINAQKIKTQAAAKAMGIV